VIRNNKKFATLERRISESFGSHPLLKIDIKKER
jgi:hypothetical protein